MPHCVTNIKATPKLSQAKRPRQYTRLHHIMGRTGNGMGKVRPQREGDGDSNVLTLH